MEEWKECTLGDISSFSQGIQVDIDNQFLENRDEYIRFVRIVDYTKNSEPPRYIKNTKKQYIVDASDLVMIRYGSQTAGRIVRGIQGAIANNMFKISLKAKINNEYLYYYLTQKKVFDFLRNSQSSSTMPAITFELASRIPILLPSLSTQEKIASILSSLDDKIECNRKINENLEQQAQALFKSWFVDFEPSDVNNFTEIGSVIETKSGGTPSRKRDNFYQNANIKWVKSKELNTGFIIDTEEKINEEGICSSSAKLLPKDSVLIAMYGATVGQYGIINEPMTCNQAICALIPNTNYPYTYLYMYAKNHKDELVNKAVGSAQQNISQVLIKQMKVSSNIIQIKKFHQLCHPLFEMIRNSTKEIHNLTQLRDTLLPKLMSGEINIE